MPLSEQLLNTHSFKMKLIIQMKWAPTFWMQDERNKHSIVQGCKVEKYEVCYMLVVPVTCLR